MTTEDKAKVKRVYGRGYFDGFKAAADSSVDKELTMTEAKFNNIYRGLTEIAKKVYQAVPMQEMWTANQVISELNRLGFNRQEHRIVLGCLTSLRDSGLVKEPKQGYFVRAEVRVKQAVTTQPDHQEPTQPTQPVKTEMPKKEAEMPQVKAKTPAPNTTPLERIGGLSAQVLDVVKQLHQLAADIDAAAIEMEEQLEKVKEDNAKLIQLKSLLKSIGME